MTSRGSRLRGSGKCGKASAIVCSPTRSGHVERFGSSDQLEEDPLGDVVVEDGEEEEEKVSLEEALQAHPCWSTESAKLGLSYCWAQVSSATAAAVAADEAAAADEVAAAVAVAAACCYAFGELLAQAAWF